MLSHEIANLIKKEMAHEQSSFITVTEVMASPDLRTAKVWVSIYGGDWKKSFNQLNKQRGGIQRILNSRLRMKFVPKIKFLIDKSQDRVERIEKLLDKDKEG